MECGEYGLVNGRRGRFHFIDRNVFVDDDCPTSKLIKYPDAIYSLLVVLLVLEYCLEKFTIVAEEVKRLHQILGASFTSCRQASRNSVWSNNNDLRLCKQL